MSMYAKVRPSITRNINGSVTLAMIVNGYRVHQTYYGYTLREAIKQFRTFVEFEAGS
jgi:hypothetical protein